MAEQRLFGHGAAPGLARGMVSVLHAAQPARGAARSPAEEAAALSAAIAAARAEAEAQAAQAAEPAAGMLEFQVAMLADDELARPALAAVAAGASAPSAWNAAMAEEIAGYALSGNAAFAARTADLEDIRDRVLRRLASGMPDATPPGAVLAAPDLPLSRFLAIDWQHGGAIVLTGGSASSHVAMLARAQGVPMVVGIGAAAAALTGCEALVDGAAGEVVLDPLDATRTAFSARISHEAAERARTASHRAGPAVTADGTHIAVHITIGTLADLDACDPADCDGIGLVRTELLFHPCAGLPDEEAQAAAYSRIARWAGGRPVVIRTLDAGGDKPVPGVTPDGESNPFLGLRGLRLALQAPASFRVQLRALARAAVHGDVRVLLPMVTVPQELAAAQALLDEAMAGLTLQGVPARRPQLGIMVEVPAAAICVGRFDADFFSVGSNDLTQYVTAAGRGIASVAALADPLNPAVLALIASVARHGLDRGRDVGLCGDAAADPRCIGPLLHAGLRSLSVSPEALGRVKQAIAAVDLRDPP